MCWNFSAACFYTRAMSSIYEQGLEKNAANHVPLTPISFIARAAEVHPERIAIIDGRIRQTWRETYERCLRLASALRKRGIGPGDTVAALMPNVRAMVEVQFAVPMSGAVLNALNTRLDAASVAFMLTHGEASMVLVDRELGQLGRDAVDRVQRDVVIVDVEADDFEAVPGGSLGYEQLIAEGDADFVVDAPKDEWDAICLNYLRP